MSNSRCCEPFHVWGISIKAPMAFGGPLTVDPMLDFSDYEITEDGFIFAAGVRLGVDGWLNAIQNFRGDTVWPVYAAKVPPFYPYHHCQKWPPISSNDPEAELQWSAELGKGMEMVEFTDSVFGNGEDPTPVKRFVRRPVYSSRVIYEDGEQKFVSYCMRSDYNRTSSVAPQQNGDFIRDYPTDWAGNEGEKWGKHVQVNIDTEEVTEFNISWLDGIVYSGVDSATLESTAMRHAWVWKSVIGGILLPEAVNQSSDFVTGRVEYAPGQHCFGLKYYTVSRYSPATIRADTIPDSLPEWDVGRVKYAGYEVFCTGTPDSDFPHTTRIKTGKDHDGDYAIMLPAIREDYDSAEDISTRHLPRVIARKYSDGTWTLVTGRWGNSDLRVGSGTSYPFGPPALDATHAFADGSIREEEVENIIYEGTGQPEVYCYNRMRGQDYVAFSILDEPSPENTFDITADFEPETPGTPGSINHGLPDGIIFTSRGDYGNAWQPDNAVYYSDPGTWSNTDPTRWGLKANSTQNFVGLTIVEIEVNITQDNSNVRFDWRLDNRAAQPDFPFFTVNTPEADLDGRHDTLEFSIDNSTIFTQDGTDTGVFEPGLPEGWSVFHHFDLSVLAPGSTLNTGKHKLKWVFQRFTQANHNFNSFAAIDNVKIENVTTADSEGTPYYYDGTVSRPIKYQIRPKRENLDNLTDRITSAIHYIAVDREDQIWYGNPHGVIRLEDDNVSKALEVQFTVVPGETLPEASGGPGGGPDAWSDPDSDSGDCHKDRCNPDICGHTEPQVETTADPPPFAFQIIPTREWIQIRGANASIKDASGLPIDVKHDRGGRYAYELAPRNHRRWSGRAHAWSISYDGSNRLPHIEVAYRLDLNTPSFPWSRDFITNTPGFGGDPPDIPPFAINVFDVALFVPPHIGWHFHFLTSTHDIESTELPDDGIHDHHPSLENRMDDRNLIIARGYTDATSRTPSHSWIQNPLIAPDGEEIGNWPISHEPWPYARAFPYPLYYPGTGRCTLGIEYTDQSGNNTVGLMRCVLWITRDDGLGGFLDEEIRENKQALMLSPNVDSNPLTDFDAVDCDCDCCPEIADVKLETRAGGSDPPADLLTS
jgi:hypothetical protein